MRWGVSGTLDKPNDGKGSIRAQGVLFWGRLGLEDWTVS